ncbi:hypothetical protein AK88_01418 [Plasmodium fragile]|uniref:Uncharacterized protein n=1 Tax=Plasmodium fragile TaxID=5857 RepID=A0A0D9QPD7_PLAFR|nr:uncharacterized protein AK88_01418 [Plasmodium fragile]KJP88924.1 hypothetical protein AK88_01418 [Plasmodium fragile]
MKLNSQGDDAKGSDVLWESLYNDFNEITKTNKRHCNYIENSLYNFCKGVSSSDNLSYNLKNKSNEWLLANHSKDVTGAAAAVGGEENGGSGDSPNRGVSRNLAIQVYLNKNDKQEEEEPFSHKDNDAESVNNHHALLDDPKSMNLRRRHSSFQPGNDYCDGQYVRNNILDVENDYLKNETYVSCTDMLNSEKTRQSEFQNNNSASLLLREKRSASDVNGGGVGSQVGDQVGGHLGTHADDQFDSSFRNGSMFNLMKYNAALKGVGIDGGISLHNGSRIGHNSHSHKNMNIGVGALSTSDQNYYDNMKSRSLHLTDPKGGKKGLFAKREDYTYLLSNKKICDSVSVGGRELERGHNNSTLLGFVPFDSRRGGSGRHSLFPNMNKYRNFTVQSDENLTCPSFSYRRSDLEGSVIGGKGGFTVDMEPQLGRGGTNDEYQYDERGSTHQGRHEDNRASYNSLEKLDQLLKSKCKYMSNNKLSELDLLFKKKNKAHNEHLRKSFISCDNYKIDSVMSETFNRNTEMDKSESPAASEQMDDISHNQLISRSQRLIEISKKCLSVRYSDLGQYDQNELYARLDKRKHGTSVSGVSYNNVIDEDECGSVFSAQKLIGKEGAISNKHYGRAYNYTNGELEEIRCNFLGGKGGSIINGKDARGQMAEEQNSKSVSKLFEAYDKDKISNVSAAVVGNALRGNPEVESSLGGGKMNKNINMGLRGDVVGRGIRKGVHSNESFCGNSQLNEGSHIGKNETAGKVAEGGLNMSSCDNYDTQEGAQGKKKKNQNKSNVDNSVAENAEKVLPQSGDSKDDQEGNSPNTGFNLASIKFPGDEEEENCAPCNGDVNKDATAKHEEEDGELQGKGKNDVYSYEAEQEEDEAGGNNNNNIPHGEENVSEKVGKRDEYLSKGDTNSVITNCSSSVRNFIKHPDFAKLYYNQKKEKVPYAEERKISDDQQKALEQCYDTINHANDVKRLFREKNFLQDLCEKRKVMIQKSKIENTKLNVEIKSLLSFNNNLSYALKEKEAEIKMLKKQKEELEMNLMKRINNNGSTQYSLLSNFTSVPALCKNDRFSGVQSDSGTCHLLRNRSSCTILNNLADVNASASVSSGGGNQPALIESYEEKIQELLAQVKMYQTKNSDLQEQLRVFMSE